MKKISLIALFSLVILVSFESKAQEESSSVVITIISAGRSITLQVVDDQNNVKTSESKFSKDNPEQLVLKTEMDNWLKKGYRVSQSYGYVVTNSTISSGVLSSRYETLILTK